jgi:hypothetical protein
VHLVGYTIEIYYDAARSYGHQIVTSVPFLLYSAMLPVVHTLVLLHDGIINYELERI